MMAKKKLKKNQLPDAEQNVQGIAGALGGNAKTVGATIVGALIGELVEAAVERLIQKAGNRGNGTSSNSDQAASDESGHSSVGEGASHRDNTPNPVQSAAIGASENLQDSLSNVKLSMRDAIDAVRSAVGDVTPRFTDVIDTLKTAPQQSKHSVQRSTAQVGNSTKTAIQEAVNTAKSAVAVLTDNADQLPKKGKKKNKKKKKS